jgi:transmembrane sensor
VKDNYTIEELWELFILDKASPEQVDNLFEHIISADEDVDHIAFIKKAIGKISEPLYKTDGLVIDSILEAIISSNDDLRASLNKYVVQTPAVAPVRFLPKWIWAAASVILLAGIGIYTWTYNRKKPSHPMMSVNNADIKPGKNGGILTLADGSQLALDSAGNGMIATQNGARVLLKNGELVYVPAATTTLSTVYNTISTPKGRQFSLVLPDGTKAWLNAASTLHYPTFFTGDERKVEVTGEVYFEVAKNARMPFRVSVNNQVAIDVLGTHFNVEAYQDDATISTTLLEGSVDVSYLVAPHQPSSAHGRPVKLKPGQQAQILATGDTRYSSGEETIKVLEADVDKTMAWKNGLFYFDGAGLYEVMHQIERWYDIKIVIEKGVRNSEFVGKLTRDVTLDQLLEGFKEFGIHYKLEGRKLTVLP